MSLLERFESKYFVAPDGCWIWSGAVRSYRYGVIWHEGKLEAAHRVSYEMKFGAIPKELVIDHLCGQTFCVNPFHLEPVTQGENVRRGGTTNKICPHGVGETSCNEGCKNKYMREWRATRKGK